MKLFYLTATGNNLAVAKALGGELYSIPKLFKENKLQFEDDNIGFIIPCYYMGVPKMVREFLKKADIKSDYIFAVMTYGNYVGDGPNLFRKLAETEGIKVAYSNALLMVDNYLPMFDMEDQKSNIPNKNIDSNMKRILDDIHNRKEYISKKKVSDKFMTLMAQTYYGHIKGDVDKKFIVEDSCTSCKLCEKVCPVDNIVVEGKPSFKHNCDECLACIQLCPVNAIRLKKEKGITRYKNSDVEVNEIIESNN